MSRLWHSVTFFIFTFEFCFCFLCWFVSVFLSLTSNVTGCHWGLKQKIQTGYKASSPKWMSYVVMRFHRTVSYSALSLRYACIWSMGIILITLATLVPNFIPFTTSSAELAHQGKITYLITNSLNHSAYSMPSEPKLSLCNKFAIFSLLSIIVDVNHIAKLVAKCTFRDKNCEIFSNWISFLICQQQWQRWTHTGWKTIDWPSFGCGSIWLSRSLVQVFVGMW